jgi:hypothetical protein
LFLSFRVYYTPKVFCAVKSVFIAPLLIISVYLDGDEDLIERQIIQLNNLLNYSKASQYDVMFAGDFNAHSWIWGQKVDRRGDYLEEWITLNNLTIHNQGYTPTWSNYRSESVLDLIITNCTLTSQIKMTSTPSDHVLISWEVALTAIPPLVRSFKRADWITFTKITNEHHPFPEEISPTVPSGEMRSARRPDHC